MNDFSDGGVHGFIIEILPVHISAQADSHPKSPCMVATQGRHVRPYRCRYYARTRSALSDVLSCRCRQLSVAMLVAF